LEELEIPPHELIIECKVGSGMTAEVFKGTFQGVPVAIKQISGALAQTIAGSTAFEREIRVMHKVKHENLVQLFGICVEPAGPLKIVAEFCAGGALFEFLHNTDVELTNKQSAKMCLDVGYAMRYLHTFDPMIIHRDLKSLNLLTAEEVTGPHCNPLVKVCDFGVAKLRDSSGDWGKQTVQAGTKHWMAPEMWSNSHYDEKVDVFSYAMVIYEILCREVPFEDEEPSDVGKFTLAGVRPDMDAVPPSCPPTLRAVMENCWRQDPVDRPAFTEIVPQLEDTYARV